MVNRSSRTDNLHKKTEGHQKARRPLILEKILNKALDSNSKDLTLFGIEDYSLPGQGIYDFFFHIIEGIPVERLCPEGEITAPVLQYQDNQDKMFLGIYELYKRNRNILTFAPKIYGEPRPLLAVCDIKKDGFGNTAILSREAITLVSEDELNQKINNWKELSSNIDNLKEEIDRKYDHK